MQGGSIPNIPEGDPKMSVVDPRPAAAQRTAASRTRIVATWLVAVPLLAFFSFSVVAGAATMDGKQPLARAVEKLPKTKTVVEISAPNEGVVQKFTHAAKLVCTVDQAQLTRVQAQWRTSTSSLLVNGSTISVVSVYGATESALRNTLGNATCTLVQVARVFFLPFDAHTS